MRQVNTEPPMRNLAEQIRLVVQSDLFIAHIKTDWIWNSIHNIIRNRIFPVRAQLEAQIEQSLR